LTYITGVVRSGKTLWAVDKALGYFKRGKPVYANFTLKGARFLTKALLADMADETVPSPGTERDPAMVIIDEGSFENVARRSMAEPNILLNQVLAMSGKAGMDLYYIVQLERMGDVYFREMAATYVHAVGLKEQTLPVRRHGQDLLMTLPCYTYEVTDMSTGITDIDVIPKRIAKRDLYPIYDTNARHKISAALKFTVKTPEEVAQDFESIFDLAVESFTMGHLNLSARAVKEFLKSLGYLPPSAVQAYTPKIIVEMERLVEGQLNIPMKQFVAERRLIKPKITLAGANEAKEEEEGRNGVRAE